MKQRQVYSLVAFLLLALVVGCGEGNGGTPVASGETKNMAKEAPKSQPAPADTHVKITPKEVNRVAEPANDVADPVHVMVGPIDQETVATIKGKVLFKGEPPKLREIDMAGDVFCKGAHSGSVYVENVVVDKQKDGDKEYQTLRNVFVYVKKGLENRNFDTPESAVTIDQNGCMYHPHVLGIQVKQKLVIKSSDSTAHNVKADPQKNQPFNFNQPKPGELTHSFALPEVMIKLQCNVHSWMNAYVGVLKHPFYGVTGKEGTFELKGLPPGEYEVEAWHEKYKTQTQTVKVGEKETKALEFTFEAK